MKQDRYQVSYWEPYFGCPLILEKHFFKIRLEAKLFARQLVKKKNLKGVQRNQVDILDLKYNRFVKKG